MSETKRKIVEELSKYFKTLDVQRIYHSPNQQASKDWLAEVAAIFKSLDEGDFKTFMSFRQHLHGSIPRETRKHAAEQLDAFVRQKVAEYKRYDFGDAKDSEHPTSYINQEIVEGFIKKNDSFDYKKLIRLIGELNSNYAGGYPYSSSMLIRGILDHIPPLLGAKSFEEVVSSYPWNKTDKKYVEKLLDFKNEGDDALHRQISGDADLLDMDDIPSSNRVNRLLQECLKGTTNKPLLNTGDKSMQGDQDSQNKGIKVAIQEGTQISWANYSQRHHVWSSFRIFLEIDNYNNRKPDYVSVTLETADEEDKWTGKHFMFQGVDKQDEAFRIEPEEVKKVQVFISDHVSTSGSDAQPMPEIGEKGLRLLVRTKSGKNFTISIQKEEIIRG